MPYAFLYIIFLIIAACLPACNSESKDHRLIEINKIIAVNPDSALVLLQKIDKGVKKSPYYALLSAKAKYESGDTTRCDSLINIAIDGLTDDYDIAEAYTYKGAFLSDSGNTPEAVEWYKKAETKIDTSDYFIQGKINFLLGELYQKSFIENNEDINKFKKALNYYTLAHANRQIMQCYGLLGKIYRYNNIDSAIIYLSKSIEYAKMLKDNHTRYDNSALLSGAYISAGKYQKAKDVAVETIKSGANYLSNDDCYQMASRAYSRLGNADSARYYMAFVIVPSTPDRRVSQLITLQELEKANNNYIKAYEYNDKSYRISDSIISHSLHNQLFMIEKRYDKHNIEIQNLEMKREITITYMVIASALVLLLLAWIFIIKNKNRMRDNLALIEQLQKESSETRNAITCSLNNESKLKQALDNQIEVVRQLIETSHRCGNRPEKFMEKFQEAVKLSKLSESFWKDLKYFVDENYNNILTRLHSAHPNLSSDEINFMGLICCRFSYIEITICMGYKNERSTCNKRLAIAKKIGIDIPLDEYLHNLAVENNPKNSDE